MKTQRNMTMIELINYVRMRNMEYASKPSAPEIILIPTKKTISSKDRVLITFGMGFNQEMENLLMRHRIK